MNTEKVLLTLELIRPKILTELTKGLSVIKGWGPQIGEVTRSGGVKKKKLAFTWNFPTPPARSPFFQNYLIDVR